MNAMLSFLQDIFSGSTTNQKPIGLNSFKEQETIKPVVKNTKRNSKELNITELMRRH